MRKSQLGLSIALMGLASVSAAEDMLFADQEMPVVLSATRLKQSIADAPASMTIIDRQMIAQSGAREIPDLLRLVPGMVVGYEKGWDAFVSYHGTSADMARRMQVLIDGRSVFQPSLAFVDWIGLPLELDDIDHIEIVRGPNAAAYGSNSFLAIVNIITRNPADLPTVRAYTRQGGEGIKDTFVSHAGVKNSLSWQISANTRDDSGFSAYFNKETLRDANGNKVFNPVDGNPVKIFTPYPYSDDKRQKSVYGQMIWESEREGSIRVGVGHSEMLAGNRSDSGIVAFLEEPDLKTEQNYLNMSFEQNWQNHHLQLQTDYSEFSSKQTIRVSAPAGFFLPELQQMFIADRIYTGKFLGAVSDLLAGENPDFPTITSAELGMLSLQIACKTDLEQVAQCGALQPDPMLTQELNYTSNLDKRESRIEAEIQDTWTLSPDLRVVYGAGIQDSRAESLHYFNGKVENTVWRLFAHGEWQFLPNWRLNAGVMDEHDDYSGNLQSPRLALNWRFAPTQSLRVVASRAYRTPDLRESQAYWQYYGQTEDRSLSLYDGYFPYLGKAPSKTGTTCVLTDSFDVNSAVRSICTNGAPVERIVSHELGYYGELAKQHLQIDVRLYHDNLDLSEHNLEVDDFVIAPTTKQEQRGVEISTQWRPHPNWRFLFNYAYDDITEVNDNTDFVPKHSGNVGAWYDGSSGVQSSLNYVFYNQLYNDFEDGGLYFDRLDWRLAKKWSVHKQHDLELAGVWQIRLTEDRELRRSNGAPRDKVWLQLSYAYD